jgi:acyl-CoA synthetase (NDP forming)
VKAIVVITAGLDVLACADLLAICPGAGYVEGLPDKKAVDAVRLDLRTEDDVRTAYEGLVAQFGASLREVSVQPMISGGTEVLISVADDRMFGPLIVFGVGGSGTDGLIDNAAASPRS